MPIVKATGYKASDGVVYATVEEAQRAEIESIIRNADHSEQTNTVWTPDDIAHLVVTQAEAVLAVLTTGPRSRPAARKRAGTTNPRRASKAQAKAGFRAMREAADAADAKNHEESMVDAFGTHGQG